MEKLGKGIFLFTIVILFAASSAFGQEVIKIGVIGPMQFVQGIGHWNGATMAAEEINAKGGIQVGNKKMKIQLIKADSNEFINITDATNAMERLITRDKADFIVGGFRPEAGLPMQDIAMEAKKIFIGVGAATDDLCTRVAKDYNTYKYWFRGSPFNSSFLVRTSFIHLATVGAILKQSLNIPKIKVAIVAEKAMWADPKIPAMQVGINVEAQKDGFWQATQKMGNYVFTMNTYARGVEYNELTKPFVDGYIKRFGEVPAYTADTYGAIIYTLAPAIEKTGTLDSDKIVAFMENDVHKTPSGVMAYLKNAEGRPLHELRWGPGYLTSLGVQWQDGELKGVWPNKWKATPEAPEVTYNGLVPVKIPPWMVEKYKK